MGSRASSRAAASHCARDEFMPHEFDNQPNDASQRLLDNAFDELIDADARKLKPSLCQNCVRYPMTPRSNTVTYGEAPTRIVVAGSG